MEWMTTVVVQRMRPFLASKELKKSRTAAEAVAWNHGPVPPVVPGDRGPGALEALAFPGRLRKRHRHAETVVHRPVLEPVMTVLGEPGVIGRIVQGKGLVQQEPQRHAMKMDAQSGSAITAANGGHVASLPALNVPMNRGATFSAVEAKNGNSALRPANGTPARIVRLAPPAIKHAHE